MPMESRPPHTAVRFQSTVDTPEPPEMDLSHLRDELADPQMAQTPGHRAHHSALSAHFRQAAQQLTGFWKSSLRSSENAYHRGYLSALADVQATLSRLSNDNNNNSVHPSSASTSTQSSALEQQMRLRNYLTARMEAVAEDVKATDSSEPSEAATSSSQASSSRMEPARPQSQLLTSFKLRGDAGEAGNPQSQASVPAFASSSSAFAPTLSGSTPNSKSERTPTFGSGSALGSTSTPAAAFANQDGPNSAARLARLQFGLPHLRSRSLVNETQSSSSSRQASSSPSSVRPSQRENGRDMDTASSHVPSSPLARHHTTPAAPISRPTNSLVERVAQAKAARASQMARSESPMPSSAEAATANADSTEAQLDKHESAPPITPSSSPRTLHQSNTTLNLPDSPQPHAQVSSSPFTFTASGSPFLVSDTHTDGNLTLSVQPHGTILTSPTFRPGAFARSGSKSSGKLAANASSKLGSLAATAAARNTPRAPPKMDYGSTDDEDQRSDGLDSDGETAGTALRMPMIRRRPPSSYGSDSERKSGGMGGASLVRPRKRRK